MMKTRMMPASNAVQQKIFPQICNLRPKIATFAWYLLTFILTFYILISMFVNNKKENLMELISNRGGRITTSEAELAGFHRMFLKQLTDTGEIFRVSRGVYQLPAFQEDELFDLQNQYPAGIFSFETALYLHSLTERAPFWWTMSFKGNYHSQTLQNKGIVTKLSSEKLYPLEIVDVKTPMGNTVKAYSAERALCEITTAKAAADIQTITYAIKTYAASKTKNIPKLLELAKTFHVEKKIRTYLEVLL